MKDFAAFHYRKVNVIVFYSADEGFDGTYPTNVVVKNNGTCLYVPPGIFKSTCKIDITWFPFDDQRCEMKFGSWTYDGFQMPIIDLYVTLQKYYTSALGISSKHQRHEWQMPFQDESQEIYESWKMRLQDNECENA
ncbi:hypothetical protein P5V15_009633 [Pogonomyrmex californicus]